MKLLVGLLAATTTAALGGCVTELGSVEQAGKPTGGGAGLLPDMRTVVPLQLNIQNTQQGEWLRFSNGIANTGAGDWRMRPGEPDPTTGTQPAIQEILDADRNIVEEIVAGFFVFHPAHNHWHMGDIAIFEVRAGKPTGKVVGKASLKVTFCLIDWYTLDGNSNTKERVYWDCATSYQGLQPGWVDQYHQSTEGQELDVTGIPAGGPYYLVSTSNYLGTYKESDYTNNTAWAEFNVERDSSGNPKVVVTGKTSACDSPGLCGIGAPNR